MAPRLALGVLLISAPLAAWAAQDALKPARQAYRHDHHAELEAAARACAAQGGRYAYQGLGLFPDCVMKMPDGGKSCTTTTDCRGGCVVDQGSRDFERLVGHPGTPAVGQCTVEEPHRGWCFVPIVDGKAQRNLCVD